MSLADFFISNSPLIKTYTSSQASGKRSSRVFEASKANAVQILVVSGFA